MMVLVVLTIGLVLWITGWAFGVKPFDAFLVTLLLVLLAAAWHIMGPPLMRLVRGEQEL